MAYTSKSTGRTYVGERSEAQARAADSITGQVSGVEGLVSGRKPFEEAKPSRLDSKFVRALGGLFVGRVETAGVSLDVLPPRGILPGGTGRAADPSQTRTSGVGGIASPLKEGLVDQPETVQRTYWEVDTVLATDGLLAFEYEPIKILKMVDAAGAPVEFQFQREP